MRHFNMVWMGFTCILSTNIILDGRYWDFKSKISSYDKELKNGKEPKIDHNSNLHLIC